jgi:hypothetical protein
MKVFQYSANRDKTEALPCLPVPIGKYLQGLAELPAMERSVALGTRTPNQAAAHMISCVVTTYSKKMCSDQS